LRKEEEKLSLRGEIVERTGINWAINSSVVCWVLIVFSTKVMGFPYCLVWNYEWNLALIIVINRNISIVKMG
jgi:hypothetical protein